MNKALPSMEFRFSISEKGKNTGKLYEGEFLYKRLNYRERNEAAKYATRLSGDLVNIDEDVKLTNSMLGTLQVSLHEYPDWWKQSNFGLDLYDQDIIWVIWSKINDFETEWRTQVWGQEPKKPEPVNDEK